MKHHPACRARVVLAGALAFLGAGCTFLISFDPVDVEADAGDASSDVIAASSDVERTFDVRSEPAAPPQDAGKDYDLTSLETCKGHPDGLYCNGNQLSPLPGGDKDDLITCIAGKVSRVRLCEKGNGCIRMLDGYPDQCDECFGRKDGVYCGRDIAWHPQNQHQRVRCQGGYQVGLLLCGTCVSSGTTSYCKP